MASLVKTFTGNDDFEAMHAAEALLHAAGFSVGTNQRGDPRGIMFGDYDISKWRNLDQDEIAQLHGHMTTNTGSMRDGPITITIFESAPDEAKASFHKTALAQAA